MLLYDPDKRMYPKFVLSPIKSMQNEIATFSLEFEKVSPIVIHVWSNHLNFCIFEWYDSQKVLVKNFLALPHVHHVV